MDTCRALPAALILAGSLVLYGCTASEEAAEKSDAPPPAQSTQAAQTAAVDTAKPAVAASQTDTSKKASPDTSTSKGNSTSSATRPLGNYCVQIGAFTAADKADAIASLAKQRFAKNVYKYLAKDTGLTKVWVGEFLTKDEARSFRDQMMQQFPDDYKDAWVAPVPSDK